MTDSDARSIVFVHGLWGSSLDWSVLLSVLRAAAPPTFRFVTVNLLGHRWHPGDVGPREAPPPGDLALGGGSVPPERSLVASLDAALSSIEQQARPALVVAHSLGSRVLVERAIARPDRALDVLLLCPLLDPEQFVAEKRRLIHLGGPEIEGRVLRPIPRVIARQLLGRRFRDIHYPAGVDRFHVPEDRLAADSRVDSLPARLTNFDPPVLETGHRFTVVHTLDDPNFDPKVTVEVAERLRRIGELRSITTLATLGALHNPALRAPEAVAWHILNTLGGWPTPR